ncbi:MAG: guanylate kinase [Pseudomonadota bacterium]
MNDASSGRLFVVSAPSGAGKTSLVKKLLARNSGVRMCVSHTTRTPRKSEVDGQDYFFVDKPEFERLVSNNEMLEHAEVFGNYYGTGRQQVDALIGAGFNVILEIDWQGARQVRSALPDCQSVFILPPSRAELERRLRQRKTDSDDVIAHRLGESLDDMGHWSEFDFVIVNDRFEEAVRALESVVSGQSEAYRSSRVQIRSTVAAILNS